MTGWNRPGLRLIAAGPALALVVAACSAAAGAGGPGLTHGPTPSPSVSPSMSMGSGATGSTAGAPAASAPALSEPSTLGGGAATGSPLHISAQNIAFNTNHLEAPAGQAFVLEFDNNDPGIPHNVEIKDANGTSVFKGQIITGPAKASYQVPAITAGNYTFVCDVHPNMTGTLAAH